MPTAAQTSRKVRNILDRQALLASRRPARAIALPDLNAADQTDGERDAQTADFNRRNPDSPSAMAMHYWR